MSQKCDVLRLLSRNELRALAVRFELPATNWRASEILTYDIGSLDKSTLFELLRRELSVGVDRDAA